jgi:hypothetical protein
MPLSYPNKGVGLTAALSAISSGAEASETLLLPYLKVSDETMQVPSVHPAVALNISVA